MHKKPVKIPPPNAPTPSDLQRLASTPENSVWVDASAGTGKTKVLTDRVLRFLLQGIQPRKILCLTFTKAAAAEMHHRIFESLSTWSICPRPHLITTLTDLLGHKPSPHQTKKARTLFFDLIDDAYGLKVLTIHSFCQQILARFPLEAHIPLKTTLMDTDQQNTLFQQASDQLMTFLQKDSPYQNAFQILSTSYKPQTLPLMLQSILLDPTSRRHLSTHSLEDLTHTLETYFELPCTQSIQSLLQTHALNTEHIKECVQALQTGSATDQKKAEQFACFTTSELTPEHFDTYYNLFFTASGSIRQRFATQKVLKTAPWLTTFFTEEAEKLRLLKERLNTLNTLKGSHSFVLLAQKLLSLYTTLKQQQALLDFDDLITTSARLLSQNQGISWVLYKLDGGLDHILVDEAQDTSPDQWQIILKLAEDFFTGETARLLKRTLFVVGDRKQSIYSFQGAEPDLFLHLRHFFQRKVEESKNAWQQISLDTSFRSCQAILSVVDAVFEQVAPDLHATHKSFRALDGGKVHLWPLIPYPKSDNHLDGFTPSPSQRLATKIAQDIKERLTRQDPLPAKGRNVQAGDFLILVQRRSAFMYQVIRALKRQNIPVAGPDRFALMDHLAVQDLLALASFLLLPEDDYALACVLKSPLFNLSEPELLDLSLQRDNKSLWAALWGAVPYQHIKTDLSTLLKKVDQLSPYALFSFVLTSLKGRQNFRARLRDECDDVLDEFLNLAFTYGHEKSNGLQGFMDYCHRTNPDVKRDFSSANLKAVRIMTVHGAKGLQAPIVFLPDTTRIPSQAPHLLWHPHQKHNIVPIWHTPPSLSCEKTEALKAQNTEKQMAEYYRLLYVALTRAEDELILAGWETSRETSDQCWYHQVDPSIRALGAQQQDQSYLYECPQHRSVTRHLLETHTSQETGLPGWLFKNPPSEIGEPEALSPSVFFAKAAQPLVQKKMQTSLLHKEPELSYGEEGSYLHKLLEILPECPSTQWESLAQTHALLYDIPDYQKSFSSVQHLLTHKNFTDIFAKNSYAEVAVSGNIQGKKFNGHIDRLIINDADITLIDFKSHTDIPQTPEHIPRPALGQLFIYKELLQKIYPHHTIRCELIWIKNASRMLIPPSFLDAFHKEIC